MTRAFANYNIAATEIVDNLATRVAKLPPPQTEYHARPLAKLDPERQAAAWEYVHDIAPEGKVTAKLVERVVKEMIPPVESPPLPDGKYACIERHMTVWHSMPTPPMTI